jgi:fatty-acyl-CoA synthase
MRQDADGYLYFVDRIGDTFRWKGENVSTNEVAERLHAAPGVKEAIVYGVSVAGAEGRAGMAGLVVEPDFDVADFTEFVRRELPDYAQPVFLRLLPDIEITGTFKPRKVDMVSEGYDVGKVRNPLYVKDPKRGYVKLTKLGYEKVRQGQMKL